MSSRKVAGALTPLIPFDRSSAIPFYKQIYEGYRAAILSGRLRPGHRLPSTRALAVELSVSRLPVVNAFEQLLHEGYVEGKTGSGTFVKDSIPDELGNANRSVPQGKSAGEVKLTTQQELGPFKASQPALEHFPSRIWGRLVSRHAKNFSIELMAYGDPAGYAPLREAIAEYVRTARAVSCDASRVLVVSGSQMALQICANALLTRSDVVAMEEPGYPGARDALKSTGAELAAIPLNEEGIDAEVLARSGRKARAVYVTPSHQYPLGISMTASRRLELLDWAQRRQAWIIEDDYDSEYRYASRPLASLQGMDQSSRVIYIGTFSKVLFPSLRVGYMVAPQALFDRFVKVREMLDIFSPTLYQVVLADFLREGHFARHIRRMRALYHLRRDALLESMTKYARDLLTPCNTEAGLHVAAFLPHSMNDLKIVRRASQNGIYPSPLSICYAGPKQRSGLILGFGGVTERRLHAAMQELAGIIKSER